MGEGNLHALLWHVHWCTHLRSGPCLMQVVAKAPPAWESEYEAWLRDRHIRQGYLRDYPDVVGFVGVAGVGEEKVVGRAPFSRIHTIGKPAADAAAYIMQPWEQACRENEHERTIVAPSVLSLADLQTQTRSGGGRSQ